jgi:hypothetical protein
LAAYGRHHQQRALRHGCQQGGSLDSCASAAGVSIAALPCGSQTDHVSAGPAWRLRNFNTSAASCNTSMALNTVPGMASGKDSTSTCKGAAVVAASVIIMAILHLF